MPALTQELRVHRAGRTRGCLLESNRHQRYSPRAIQKLIQAAAKEAGIELLSYPPATALPDPSTVRTAEGSSISSPCKARQAASSSASPGSASVWRWKR